MNIVVEGPSDEAVVTRLLDVMQVAVGNTYGLRGKGAIDKNLDGFNKASKFGKWLVVRDFDDDAVCPGDLVRRLLPNRLPTLCLRLAVRCIESWLLADRPGIAKYLAVRLERVPRSPDTLVDPKSTLIELARTSRRSGIRDDFVPGTGSSARVGKGYTAGMVEFARIWSPEEAAKYSGSLQRAISAIRVLRSGEGTRRP